MTELEDNRCPACGARVMQASGRCSCGNWYDTGFLSQIAQSRPVGEVKPVPTLSDGSTADYYDFPAGMTQLQDLIAYLDCNAQMGEIGRAWMRYGRCGHSERKRDLRKIIFYASAELNRLEKYGEEDSSLHLDDMIESVIGWAAERGIFDSPNPQAQLLKTLEELGEVAHGLARNDLDKQIDGVGDVIVTLILFAHIQGFDLDSALSAAWNEIKDRKGKMQNGFFVKQEA